MNAPTQKTTRNYAMFEVNNENRLLTGPTGPIPRRNLVLSMQKYGFIKSCPIVCRRSAKNKLVIHDGHNRLIAAAHLNIPVEYICYEDDEVLQPTEFSATQKQWGMADYTTAFSHDSDKPDYIEVLNYHRETGIPLNDCYSLFVGESAGSNNQSHKVKVGLFTIKTRVIPEMVKAITSTLNRYCDYGSSHNMVVAVSKIIHIEGFVLEKMVDRIHKYSELIKKCRTHDEYIDLLDLIYNRNTKVEKLYFRIGVEKAMKSRSIKLIVDPLDNQTTR